MKYILQFFLCVFTVFSSFSQTKTFELQIELDSSLMDSIKIWNKENADTLSFKKIKVEKRIYNVTGNFKNDYLFFSIVIYKDNESHQLPILVDTSYQVLKVLAFNHKVKSCNLQLLNMPYMNAQAYYYKHLYFEENEAIDLQSKLILHLYGYKKTSNFDSLKAVYKILENAISQKKQDFYSKFPDSYITGYYFSNDQFYSYPYDSDFIYDLLIKHNNPFYSSDIGRLQKEDFDLKRKYTIGKSFPNFSFNNHLYQVQELKEIANSNYTLVHLWATWCKPCINEMQSLDTLYAKYQSKLKMVSISLDNDEDKWVKYLTTNGITGVHTIFHENYIHKDYLLDFRYTFIPQYILIDKNLNIVWRDKSDIFSSFNGRIEMLDYFLQKN